MTGSSRRKKGHDFERWCAKWWRRLYPNCRTSRETSRFRDAQGVDLTGIPYAVQCKATERLGSYHAILKAMPGDEIRILFHKKNHQGVVVAMMLEDFETLMEDK